MASDKELYEQLKQRELYDQLKTREQAEMAGLNFTQKPPAMSAASTAVAQPTLSRPEATIGAGGGYTPLEKFKSLLGGLGTGVTMGMMNYAQDYPAETAPTYHSIGEFAGAFAPISAGMRVATAPIKAIAKPWLKHLVADVGGGALYETATQAGKAVKGEGFDVKRIPETAAMFGAFGGALGGASAIVRKVLRLRQAGKFAEAKKLYDEASKKYELPPMEKIEKPISAEERAIKFQQKITEHETKLQNFVEEIGDSGGEFEIANGKVIVSKNIDPQNLKKYPWRITRFNKEGLAAGHDIYRDTPEVAQALVGYGARIKLKVRELRPDDNVIWSSPHSGKDVVMNFRGYDGNNAVLYNPKSGMQVSVPREQIKIAPQKPLAPKVAKPLPEAAKPAPPEVLAEYPELAGKKAMPKKLVVGAKELAMKRELGRLRLLRSKMPKVERAAKVETAEEAVAEIIEGKRESKLGTKEFKERMLSELGEAKKKAKQLPKEMDNDLRRDLERYGEMPGYVEKYIFKNKIPQIIIKIPQDGEFTIYNTRPHIEFLEKKVNRLAVQPKESMGPQYPIYRGKKGALKEYIKEGKVEFIPKKKPPTELGAFGTPEALRGLGESVVSAAKAISKATSEIIEKAKPKPEIRAGVAQAKTAITEQHDVPIRSAEFTSKQLKKVIDDAVPNKDRQMLMVHAYEHKMRGPYWDNLTDLEQSLVGWLGKEKAKLNQFIKDNDILEMMPENEEINHIFHHWINPQSGKPYKAMYGRFSKGLPQAKQRTITDYATGIEKGMKPATTNLGELIGLEWEAVARAHHSRQMFGTIYNIAAEGGKTIQRMVGKKAGQIRMIERWDLLEKQGLTEGYTRYSHYALDKPITFKTPDGKLVKMKGPVGVRKELYPFVRAYIENPNYGSISNLMFATKSLKLTYSLFHVMSLGMQELANWRVPFKNIPRGLKLIKELGPEMKILYEHGLEIFKGYEDVGYQRSFFDAKNWVGKAGNLLTKYAGMEHMRRFIFEIVQPGMKASFAYDKYNKLLPKYLKRGWTKEKCARDVVQAADGHFSGEHWKRSLLETNRFMVRLYFMPEARRAWQQLLLSPTWQREHLLVAKNVAKSFLPDKFVRKLGLQEMGPIKAEYRKYLLGAIMIVGAVDLMNQYTTKLMDGEAKHIWQNPSGKFFAIRAPWDEPDYTTETEDGKTRKIKGGPTYIRPLKSIYEVPEFLYDPPKKFANKLSPFMTAIARQMSPGIYQKQYKGWGDIPQRVWDAVIDVGTPISASQIIRVAEGKRHPLSATTPFFGFPSSKLSQKEIKESYYKRFAKLDRKSEAWRSLMREFENRGYRFDVDKYNEIKNK